MPIERLMPTRIVQVCAECGANHSISLNRGAQKTKTGPFALEEGATLELSIDGAGPIRVTFRGADVRQLASVTADELAAVLTAAAPALDAREDFGGCLIESRSEARESRIRIVSGSACDALGLGITPDEDHEGRPPRLGFAAGGGSEPNVIVLRRCPCGSHEVLLRTFDRAPRQVVGSFFDRHRRAANTLAEHLKRNGQSHPALADVHAKESSVPSDIAAFVLGGELVVGVPPAEGLEGE